MVFPNEPDLIVRLKAGEKKAVEEWYRGSYPKLLSFFVKKTSNEHDAQELAHDTYLSCLSSLPLFRGQSGLFSWMLSIARHELADYWRKRYAKRMIKALPLGEEILKQISNPPAGEAGQVQNLLTQMPNDIAELLQLKYIDGYSVKDLAKKFGLSVVAMQSKLYRARMTFQEEFEKQSS
ncbi:MAG TPA: RNA polymerase sigma factor [Patescibacteria group bacterium]|nr:RNA polymerase sigma factor [Patescibacteria group bacterium]